MLAVIFLAPGSYAACAGSGPSDWRFKFDVAGVKQFETSLDDGGDFDIDRFYLQFGVTRTFGKRASAGLSLGYGQNRYGFSGDSGFGGRDPWGKIQTSSISMPLSYRGDSSWSFFAIPSLRYQGENNARRSKSDRWGVIAGAAYRVGKRLSIGPGFGAFSGLEESNDVFPILLLDWKITDTLKLETGRGLAASLGPGLSLKWTPRVQWEFALSGRYEKSRFRLDKNGPVADGVGQDKSFPLALSASYKPNRRAMFSLLGGADFKGKLRLENADGSRLDSSDYNTAPFLGLIVSVSY